MVNFESDTEKNAFLKTWYERWVTNPIPSGKDLEELYLIVKDEPYTLALILATIPSKQEETFNTIMMFWIGKHDEQCFVNDLFTSLSQNSSCYDNNQVTPLTLLNRLTSSQSKRIREKLLLTLAGSNSTGFLDQYRDYSRSDTPLDIRTLSPETLIRLIVISTDYTKTLFAKQEDREYVLEQIKGSKKVLMPHDEVRLTQNLWEATSDKKFIIDLFESNAISLHLDTALLCLPSSSSRHPISVYSMVEELGSDELKARLPKGAEVDGYATNLLSNLQTLEQLGGMIEAGILDPKTRNALLVKLEQQSYYSSYVSDSRRDNPIGILFRRLTRDYSRLLDLPISNQQIYRYAMDLPDTIKLCQQNNTPEIQRNEINTILDSYTEDPKPDPAKLGHYLLRTYPINLLKNFFSDPRFPLASIYYMRPPRHGPRDQPSIYEMAQTQGITERMPNPDMVFADLLFCISSNNMHQARSIARLNVYKFDNIDLNVALLSVASRTNVSETIKDTIELFGKHIHTLPIEHLISLSAKSSYFHHAFGKVTSNDGQTGHKKIIAAICDGIGQLQGKEKKAYLDAWLDRYVSLGKETLDAFLLDPRLDLQPIRHAVFQDPKNNLKSVTLERYIMESGNPELVARLPKAGFVVRQNSDTSTSTIPIIPDHFTPENVKKAQRLIARKSAEAGITRMTGINLSEATNRTKAKKDKVFSEHSISPKLVESKVFERLEEAASTLPYYLKHGFNSSYTYEEIMKSGVTLSQSRIHRVQGQNTAGLNTESDRQMGSYQYSFFGLGTNSNNLPTPASLRTDASGYIIIDTDAIQQREPSLMRGFVVKGEDWGSSNTRVISIPGTKATIQVSRRPVPHPELGYNVHSPESTEVYHYHNPETGVSCDYSFTLSEEVSLGPGYKELVPNLIAGHLAQLPQSEQDIVMRQILDASLSGNSEKITAASQAYVDAFYYLEASFPGTLPLHLAYVERIKAPGENSPVLEMKPLRKAVQQGNLDVINQFFHANPSMLNVDWLISSMHALATEAKQEAVLKWLEEPMQATRTRLADKVEVVPTPPRELSDIARLQRLLLENESPDTRVLYDPVGEHVVFETQSHNGERGTGTQHRALANIYLAAGNTCYINQSSFELELPEHLEVHLDGKEHNPSSNTGHSAFQNLTQLRNSLMARELENLMVSKQNEVHYKTEGHPHPLTGKGATGSRVQCLEHRLPFSIKVSTTPRNQFVTLEIEPKEYANTAWAYLRTTLPSLAEFIKLKDNVVGIAKPIGHVLTAMKQQKCNYQGVFTTDETGNLLVANRRGQGLKTAGGHNSDNYHPTLGASIELKEEFGLQVKPDQLDKLPLIARVGPYNDIAILHIPYAACNPTEEALDYQKKKALPVAFRAELSEFEAGSEEVLSHKQMRGREFASELPLNEFIAYETRCLNTVLHQKSNIFIVASINSDITLRDKFQVPDKEFGTISLQVRPEAWEQAKLFLKENNVPILNKNKDQHIITIDAVNPLRLVSVFEGKALEKTASEITK